ncbi:sulfurtransferase [Candidatus Bathyarchaeota archaeon]|jgi:rhodanese-related sulfurtransferase|nr:sulfurtransferase [Candidatus Bathyarchaeota archaeon]MDP6048614.1 rhodanese-like domain-containing protein [Candidatus Bathyarchaeota archaeon]MDP7442812.1 rhodanese-like domain-containing protein [Candidatus Bathyarchaeota archaeon]|tara:strand:- start:1062 stop:1496 length:435 start_codon:yes stop_codon:yes gene_type:complete
MSVAKYHLKPIVIYWKKILKLILHFSGLIRSEWSEISVYDLFNLLNSNYLPLLIDIRSPTEFSGGYGHIPQARSIPLLELASYLENLQSFKEKTIVTMCPGGGMSLIAVEILTEAGFTDVKSLKGGTDLWHQCGYPTTRSNADE